MQPTRCSKICFVDSFKLAQSKLIRINNTTSDARSHKRQVHKRQTGEMNTLVYEHKKKTV